MKKIICILCFFLLILLSIGAQDKVLLLYGKVKNGSSDTIVLSNHYGRYITTTDQYGRYRFELKIKDPDFLNFNIKNNHATLFLLAGDTLEMSFDNNNFEKTISFHGQPSEFNLELLSASRGKLAPGFSFKDINGKTINLKDFKGKYVYIDVWNSACGPCFKEFPVMEALVEKYKSKNIAFLGISLDKNEKTWSNTVNNRKIKGVQLFGNGWDSEFTSRYFIKFNPRFILIDPDQRIMYLSAPRPSGNIDDIFKKLKGI